MPAARALIVDAENPGAAIADTGAALDERVCRAVGDAYNSASWRARASDIAPGALSAFEFRAPRRLRSSSQNLLAK